MNKELRDELCGRLDRILCLTCPQSINTRFPSLVAEFSAHGLGDLLLPFPNVHSVVEHAELDRRRFANQGAMATNVKNCTMGHYHMAKFAEDAGYDNVMLIEDDCRFIVDDDMVLQYFRELPRNTNSILSYRGLSRTTQEEMFSSPSWRKWNILPGGSFFDLATCYILHRDGIHSLVQHYENAGTEGYEAPVDACDRAWPFLSRAVPVYLPRTSLFVPSGSPSVTEGKSV